MVTGLRKTGIGVVGDLPWGTHFCHFYATKEDLIDILIPYFQAGLESNEFCMWVVFDLLKVEEAKDALRAAVPGADRHLAAGNIEILPHSQWYLKDGTFDLRHVIDGWKEKLARALASGYEGMRVNGNEAWLTEKDWKDFSAYEKELNKLISDQRILVLCTYPLEVTKAAELFDVARTHQFAIAKRHGVWEVVETPDLKRAKAEIQKLNEELAQRVFEQTKELAAANVELGMENIERKRAEEALQKSEGELRTLFAAMTDVVLVLDAEGRYVKIAPTNPLNLYRPSEQLLGKRIHEILPKNEADSIFGQIGRALETRQTIQFEYKLGIGSREVWFDGRISRLTENTVFWIAHDITERKHIEDALRESERRYSDILNKIELISMTLDRDARVTFCNDYLLRLTGWRREEVLGSSWFERFIPPESDGIKDSFMKLLDDLPAAWHNENEILTRSGERRFIRWSNSVLRAPSGEVIGTASIGEDITDNMRAKAEKEKLQAQLQQAMKMEAVGRLAGGVAHDFNNLLTAIIGNVSLAHMKLPPSDPAVAMLKEANKAAERAATLTQQLLAFSRKQIIEPKVLNLNELISDLHAMLVRLIREDINIQILPGKDLGAVKVDVGQFQQVLVNLVVNARDAMPDGGKIVIKTSNAELDDVYCADRPYVKPGRFVMVAVSDTGGGMSEEVKAHIFEPFFTTKAKGSGTGLGLATTYGVVKQAEGFIEVYSEVGMGTTFKIYLPRVEEKASHLAQDDKPLELLGGTETILFVEDEDIVRDLGTRILKDFGYKVLHASNGEEAIALARGYEGRIDLLMTDVVMPGMNGRELATQLVLHRPEMKVLFTSGYTENVIVHHGVLDDAVSFIEKPYSPSTLVKKIREVLDKAG